MSSRTLSNYSQIPFVELLQDLGQKVIVKGDDEIHILCPYHGDKSPSLGVNLSKGVFRCRSASCAKTGRVIDLYAKVSGKPISQVSREWATQFPAAFTLTSIDLTVVEDSHSLLISHLKENPESRLHGELRKRGITIDMLRRGRIGIDPTSLALRIPIRMEDGAVVNIKDYRIGQKTNLKMVNAKGRGESVLYNSADLKHERVWICGGEMKALAASHLFDDANHDIGAVAGTNGEGNWDPTWSFRFKNKQVWICMDIDAAGRAAATRVALSLHKIAKSVKVITLPLDPNKYPKGDLNDFLYEEKATADSLLQLMESAREFEPEAPHQEDTTIEFPLVTFQELSEHGDEQSHVPFQATASIIGRVGERRTLPKAISVSCTMSHPKDLCGSCAIKTQSMGVPNMLGEFDSIVRVNPLSPRCLDYYGKPDKIRIREILQNSGIVRDCPNLKLTHDRSEYVTVDMVVLEQQGSGSATSAERYSAVLVQNDNLRLASLHPGRPILVKGFTAILDATTEKILYVTEAIDEGPDLDDFQLTDTESEELKLFSPVEWTVEAIEEKVTAIAGGHLERMGITSDLADIVSVIDLTYHSPLYFNSRQTMSALPRMEKGWVNSLIIGDTALGKSTLSLGIAGFYGLGEMADCKSSTSVGLTIGLEAKANGQWTVNYGSLTRNDRGLCILEEMKGLSTQQISTLTSTRSTGEVRIDKIIKVRAPTRTRILAISNPREGALGDSGYGVLDVLSLVGQHEDVRRFDIVAGLRRRSSSRTFDGPRLQFDSSLAQTSVLRAWSTKAEQIEFSAEFYVTLDRETERMSEKYESDIPLVEGGASFRIKVQRLATSLAARLHCYSPEGILQVLPEFVVVVCNLMHRLYDDEALRYSDYAEAYRSKTHFDEQEAEAVLKNLCLGFQMRYGSIKKILSQPGSVRSLPIGQRDDDRTSNWISRAISSGMISEHQGTFKPTESLLRFFKNRPTLDIHIPKDAPF